ncbi:hypothetical protein F0562_029098 [Nyssa sinensis]|uniref:C3H1-type domain-containing protein n=1 Tax=Nyssa sinensis TaxID=561372 RepID=A0A5J5B240_9ASTE|nr:hypothetical protein F0562_029098 [Nyssa sinensis]
MEEPLAREGAPGRVQENQQSVVGPTTGSTATSRKDKRKAAKKEKRKQKRSELAAKEREEEEARLNDPEEQRRIQLEEERENDRLERERKEFEERERQFLEALAAKRKAEEEEEERRKTLKEESNQNQVDQENELKEDEDWEYVEEGPPEIIWQGNEIIVKKKRVRVKKKDVDLQTKREDPDRPTSNPLPPQSEAFTDYKNGPMVSAQQLLDNVAQQMPNFGTEQDKAHCPFHLKTGACRFGSRCSRVHFYPDKSCTLLIKNMYNGPGLAWEQDEGLEVCKNGSSHLRGNVYVHYKFLDSAVLAYNSINDRYFAGKQIKCEFVGVTRWKVAICGEYMKSRVKTCSRGMACNFIHCFRNPGGDYEWADWDKPPPKYWVEKMAALFGYSDEIGYDKQMEQESLGQLRNSSKMITADTARYHSRRSQLREMDCLNSTSSRGQHEENDTQKSMHRQRRTSDGRKQIKIPYEKHGEEDSNSRNNQHGKKRSRDTDSDGDGWDRDTDGDRHHDSPRRSSRHQVKMSAFQEYHGDRKSSCCESGSDGDWSDRDRDRDRDRGRHRGRTRKSSKQQKKLSEILDSDADWSDRDRDRNHGCTRKSLKQLKKVSEILDDHGYSKKQSRGADSSGEQLDEDKNEDRHHSHRRKTSRHRSKVSEPPDDYWDVNNRTRYGESDSDGDWLDRDKDRQRDGHYGRIRKSSRHQKEVSEILDDGHNGKQTCGTDSSRDRLDEDIGGDRQNSCRRKSSGCQNKVSESPDDHWDSKNIISYSNSSGDWLNRDRDSHRACTRKHSTQLNEMTGFSDVHGESEMQLNHRESDLAKFELQRVPKRGHSSRRDSSSRKKTDGNLLMRI